MELAIARADVALDAPVIEPMPVAARSAFQTLRWGYKIHRVHRSAEPWLLPMRITEMRAMIANRARPQPRAPTVAGAFYPRSQETLRQTVDNLLSGAAVEQRSQRCGIIAPHAGYAYSGHVAATAFAGVRSCGSIKRAIVIGPAHFVPFSGLAAPSVTAFMTPLGEVPVD